MFLSRFLRTGKLFSGLILVLFCWLFTLSGTLHAAVVETYVETVQRVYIAYYGRPADPAGLDHWTNQLNDANGNLDAIIESFANATESQELYGSLSNSERITTIYQQLLNRAPDTAGLNFYTEQLNSGASTQASIMLDILNGAINTDAGTVNNKLTVATAFTNGLDTTAETNAYNSTTAASIRSWLAAVTDTTNTSSAELDIGVITGIDTSGGTTTSDAGWIINNTETSTHIMSNGSPALVNVQSAETSGNFTVVSTTGVPGYQTTITQDLHNKLTTRPKAATDFASGSPTVSVGDVVNFGQDIGFNSNSSCVANEGQGYWPPGPVCPEDTGKSGSFPSNPIATSEACDTGLGPVGYYVNGVSIYNWGDGQSYNGQGVWTNSAAVAEQYDIDICDGHAANGDYHHHFYSACLADLVGDTGNGHSPVYGYAADGYPVHGPWYADGVLAVSSWVTRNYDDPSDPYGCGGTGARTCLMVDEYDPSQGTTTASSAGPGTSDTITTLSSNQVSGASGFYYEDYYWDSSLTAQGGRYLDQNNGHEHAGVDGYHYHLTVSNDSGSLLPAFPYTIGPRFHGTLQDGAVASCSTGNTPSGPPPGGGNGPPPRR